MYYNVYYQDNRSVYTVIFESLFKDDVFLESQEILLIFCTILA